MPPRDEGGNTNGQLTQERQIQLISPDATLLPALLASVVSAVEAPARRVSAGHAQILDDLNADSSRSQDDPRLSGPSESAEVSFAARAWLTLPHVPKATLGTSGSWTPLHGVPVTGFLPFDMETLAQGVDKLFDQLANLGRPWNDPRLRIEIAFWLTTVAAAVFEFTRLRARKSLCHSFQENSVRHGLATGMEHEL
jgi:hypothetical protein